jgi:hypothetical protein
MYKIALVLLASSLGLEHRLGRPEEERAPATRPLSESVIEGTVRGNGAAGAEVVLVGGHTTVRARADRRGHFQVRTVRAGAHVLFVEVDGRLVERWLELPREPIFVAGMDLHLDRPTAQR